MRVICLCGSTKFKRAYLEWSARLALEGNVTLTVSLFSHADHLTLTDDQVRLLNRVHTCRIDMADEIFVLDVGGYYGQATREDIVYAKQQGKSIRYLSEVDPSWTEADCRWVPE